MRIMALALAGALAVCLMNPASAATKRSQVSAIIRGGLGAVLAPSISHSVSFCRCEAFMG